MSDQGSTYAVLQSIPVMVSPLYKLPKRILIASELQIVSDDIKKVSNYPFAIEREVIAQVEAARKKALESEEAFNLQKKQYEEEKMNKQKAAARKIAPGFLDTDTRILQPKQTYVHEYPLLNKSEDNSEDSDAVSPNVNNNEAGKVVPMEIGHEKHFDYLKFEQGLAPADPWDTPENDMVALRSLLGSPKSSSYSPTSTTSTPPPYPYQPSYPQLQHSKSYQKNEGVYWNFQPNATTTTTSTSTSTNYPLSQQHLQRQHMINSVPALPPKLFNNTTNSLMPTPSVSSPIISTNHSIHQTSATNNSTAVSPPPLPPLPLSQPAIPREDLITELCNMGFSRTQAIDALEKNNYDMMKATNFLLDQA
ncbi:uncharacterized protein BX663DRAFT_503507 [Cokeromyces recurvatus]|uniref:uncharacterized protein n=1 Tax=Cokeromyces recurvatus TaxID=90255 RepID=UPI00221F6BDC|nr:uncharacterized protein BX663DRAFT_503507 [Cokeromyces recurvatus]KAI7904775.1 hypothetical protein BX663DRAFT_503507 [Cokeromyces recurvatus]